MMAPTHVQNGFIKQSLLGEEQEVQNSPGTPVPVFERMDCLELVVADRHSNERIEILPFVDESFSQLARSFRR